MNRSNQSIDVSQIETMIQQVLQHLYDSHSEFSQDCIQERYIGVRVLSDKIVIDLFSTGLSLQRKSYWEKKIVTESSLHNVIQALSLPLQVNFTKKNHHNVSQSFLDPVLSPPAKRQDVAASATPALKNIGALYAVASGKGGVGKSSVSAYIARLLHQKQRKVGLLDADIHGPSSHMLMDLAGDLRVSAQGKIIPQERNGLKCVSFGFLSDDTNPVVWRGPMLSKAVKQFLFEVEWGELDNLILDLPPGTGDIPMTLVEQVTLDGVIIVTTPHPIALIDAHKAITMFQNLCVPILGIVANMTSYICPHCAHKSYPFGDDAAITTLSKKCKVPIVARIPLLSYDTSDISNVPSEVSNSLNALTEQMIEMSFAT